jgi:hypothetical protein
VHVLDEEVGGGDEARAGRGLQDRAIVADADQDAVVVARGGGPDPSDYVVF